LVTHWPAVDDAATLMVADLMRRQADGASSAAALRGAQLLFLNEAGGRLPAEFAHPYYWAVFAVIGDGRRKPAPRRVAAL
jgi:CHAT domain-containing protein